MMSRFDSFRVESLTKMSSEKHKVVWCGEWMEMHGQWGFQNDVTCDGGFHVRVRTWRVSSR